MQTSEATTTLPIVTGCAQSDYQRAIYDNETWIFLQKAYLETQDKYATISESYLGVKSIRVPYEVKEGKRGRGVVMTGFVEEGTQIWEEYHHAEFRSEKRFRKFMKKLPYALQCEILLWAYPQGRKRASVDLDEGSFINHSNDEEERNFANSGRASRDIQAGEELLMDYGSFIAYNQNKWFDEIRSAAWAEKTEEDPEDETGTLYETTDEYNLLGAPKQIIDTQTCVGDTCPSLDLN
mmetsp:Transcript_7058/g.10304  ORF Transcript_7058/g.10304 Transcript_7058/m.10304 type:complete len:237 (-) Transcript_7058:35-745(-)|eukprot:CAMPEP_0194204164 /NCGR_PEP_ID=MMETSP0156-20130528/3771_1 /TAXON_ID=33649 /ORGANISM="Thalassionema nitzschioides, Strain L26-B" /LENGTH=236 /DNA_ID=CAMNT_0038930115 /DNA_START=83 /DNA_END=793 /DNA_ORIENTATION=-